MEFLTVILSGKILGSGQKLQTGIASRSMVVGCMDRGWVAGVIAKQAVGLNSVKLAAKILSL